MKISTICIDKYLDSALYLRTEVGTCPIGDLYAHLKINGSSFHARFSLGDNSRPLYSDCPFEEIAISLDRKQVEIKGAPATLHDDKKGDRIQGVILALVPSPKGGNQYVVIFIDQKFLQKGHIYYCSGTNGSVLTIYRSLAASMEDAGQALLENFQGGDL